MIRRRLGRPVVVLVALACAAAAIAPAASTAEPRVGFIVVLKDTVDRAAPVAAEHAVRFDGSVSYVSTSTSGKASARTA